MACYPPPSATDSGSVDSTVALLESAFTDSDWYIQETFIDVPHGAPRGFSGLSSEFEKIRWELNDEFLIAYRAYEVTPGSDPDAGRLDWHEQPVAMYPVLERIKAGDGKEFKENAVRIDWRNAIDGPLWFGLPLLKGTSFTVRDRKDDDAFLIDHFEPGAAPPGFEEHSYEAGSLYYVDFTNRMVVEPLSSSLLDCRPPQDPTDWTREFDPNLYEVAIRTSLLRVPSESEYEPLEYDTVDQSRFGFFRSARVTYDEFLGERLSGVVQMANRQNLWSDTWERDSSGRQIVDEDGRPIARPLSERTPRPVVYYLSEDFPDTLRAGAYSAAEEWDGALRRAVAVAKGLDPGSVPQMLVLCQNPVTDGDPGACGAEGTTVHQGDLRYRRLTVVPEPQLCGPLGFGPSSADPETGEIIWADAAVYGDALNAWTNHAVDLIRFVNGDLTIAELKDAEDIRQRIRSRLDGKTAEELSAQLLAVDGAPVPGAALDDDSARRVRAVWQGAHVSDAAGALDSQRLETLHGMVQDRIDGDAPEAGLADLAGALAAASIPPLHPRQGCYLERDIHDSLIGFARRYLGRTDYEQIREEVREVIHRNIALHEIGHTLGLRHNFAASSDYVNYRTRYWQLKATGVYGIDPAVGPTVLPLTHPIVYLNDIHLLSEQTPIQVFEGMREHSYSSVMDYGASFNSDIHGIGKYDEAAILYGYTAGREGAERRRGYVEVFDDPAGATGLLQRFAGATDPDENRMVEEVHYHTFARYLASDGVDFMLGQPANPGPNGGAVFLERLTSRSVMRGDEIAGSGAIEVPYLYYEDLVRDAKGVAMAWDQGADPFEQVRDLLGRYRELYPFHYFGRDRIGVDPWEASLRVGLRLLVPLQIAFDRYYLALIDPPIDPILLASKEFAGLTALNALAEVAAMTPSYGSYANDGGTYRLTSLSPQPGADLVIPPGPGRRFDSVSAHVPLDTNYSLYHVTEVGHRLTSEIAQQILAGVVPTRLLESGVGFEETRGNSMVLFGDRITTLFNALYLQDSSIIGPRVMQAPNGSLFLEAPGLAAYQFGPGVFVDPETLSLTVPPVDSDFNAPIVPHVDVAQGGPQKRLAGLFGMALLLTPGITGVGLDFQDQARVFRVSSGEELQPGPGFETLVYCATLGSGVCYGALAPIDTTDPGLAARLILRAQLLHPDAAAGDFAAALELEAVIQDMDYLRALYEVFGSL